MTHSTGSARLLLATLLATLLTSAAQATTTGNSWLMWFPTVSLGDGWSLASDFQLRQSAALTEMRQLHARGTIVRDLSANVKLGVGYLHGETTAYNTDFEKANIEHRLHQQVEYKPTEFPVRSRLRLEQRFLETADSNETQHRLRYRALARWPKEGALYAVTHNEVFLNLGKSSQVFSLNQNRLYGAAGLELNETWKVELGSLWQAQMRDNRDPLHVIALQISVFTEL